MMKLFKLFILLTLFISCKDNSNYELLYNELTNYKTELNWKVKNQENYLFMTSRENNYFRKRYDSLNKIELKLDNYFEMNRYKNRNNLIVIRDKFNTKFKLSLQLISANHYQNINDTLFNRLIELEFLKLRLEFQNRYMFIHRDKFN